MIAGAVGDDHAASWSRLASAPSAHSEEASDTLGRVRRVGEYQCGRAEQLLGQSVVEVGEEGPNREAARFGVRPRR